MAAGLDFVWLLVSFILTLFVFSYLLGDNPIFRFVSALFIGVSAGYFLIILLFQLILPRLVVPIAAGDNLVFVPLFLSGLLLMKLSPRLSKLGNIPLALLVGAGAAIAIGGAVIGTLFGQVKGAINAFNVTSSESRLPIYVEGIFLLLGTLATLAYFQFQAKPASAGTSKRGIIVAIFAWIGKGFIAITLGAVFAGVLTAAITAFIERSDFIIQTVKGFFH
jgi:hypothetical protein